MMFKSKIHSATATGRNLDYEGSLTLDEELIEVSDILENEEVGIYNLTNVQRFHTHVIKGRRGSGEICLNEPSARLGSIGDLVIICSYALYEDQELSNHNPKIVYVGSQNKIIPRKKG